jgi:hypothetical protein
VSKGVRGFLGKAEFATYARIDVGGNGFVGASKGKVVDLAAEKDLLVLVSGDINILLVSGGLEIEFLVLEDLSNVFFPADTGLRMAL